MICEHLLTELWNVIVFPRSGLTFSWFRFRSMGKGLYKCVTFCETFQNKIKSRRTTQKWSGSKTRSEEKTQWRLIIFLLVKFRQLIFSQENLHYRIPRIRGDFSWTDKTGEYCDSEVELNGDFKFHIFSLFVVGRLFRWWFIISVTWL